MTISERAVRRRLGNGVEVKQRKVAPPPPQAETSSTVFNPEGLPVTHVPFEQMFPALATYYNRPPEWDDQSKPFFSKAPAAPKHSTEPAQIIISRKAKHSR